MNYSQKFSKLGCCSKGLLRILLYLFVTLSISHPLLAADEVPDVISYHVYLPMIAQQHRSVLIEQMAALLPSEIDCTNCLTRETFLALPADELARIEQGEQTVRKVAEQLEQQDQLLRDLVARGELDTSTWPSAEQIALMTPEEISQVVVAQKGTLATYATSANLQSVQAVNGAVTIAYLPAANIQDNINSCGPASIRVALSVRKSTSQIASINTIGTAVDKNTNGTQGNWKNGIESEDLPRVATYMNTQLGFGASNPYYRVTVADSAANFRAKADITINNNLAMIFGAKTNGLPDWTLTTNHIVTAYAVSWDAQSYSVISWADTAPIISGHYKVVNGTAQGGAYYNARRTTDLWPLVSANNFQISN